MDRKWISRVLPAGAALVLALGTAHAQPPPLEYQAKASFVYNFILFTDWPDDVFSDNGNFNLCVLSPDPFGRILDALAGERATGHPIAIKRLGSAETATEARCHLVFVSAAHRPSTELLKNVSGHGVLTVGEASGFADRGGVINLVEDRGRLRFEVNRRAAERAGLRLSSRLLNLAVERP